MAEQITIDISDLSALMPFFLSIDADGTITDAGQTIQKICRERDIVGANLFDVFAIRQRRSLRDHTALVDMAGDVLKLSFRDPPGTGFKGSLVPLSDGAGYLINLSLGIGVIQALGDFSLNAADFSDTDLAIEMLYLNEAQSAVLQESRQLVKRLQGARIAAEEKAFTDTLTGLKNRRAMDFVLQRLIRAHEPFGLMHLDLDFFKEVNDTMGHAAGDYVLQNVARILIAETRGEDTVARVGGDEFVLIMKGLVDPKLMRLIGERIIRALERPVAFNGEELRISASIGAAVTDDYDKPDPAEMMEDADIALYASKDSGRAAFTQFTPELADRRRA